MSKGGSFDKETFVRPTKLLNIAANVDGRQVLLLANGSCCDNSCS